MTSQAVFPSWDPLVSLQTPVWTLLFDFVIIRTMRAVMCVDTSQQVVTSSSCSITRGLSHITLVVLADAALIVEAS